MTGLSPGLMDVTLGTADLDRAIRFYDPVMAVLGLARLPDAPPGWAGWGPPDGPGLWLCAPFDGRPATAGNGSMVTFRATGAAQVRAFHAAALAHGGTDEGPPGTRPAYDPGFYVAYVRDPDGHKLACADPDHDPKESEA
jgi:catechol 2,3-dioxygenase-like lactoylglutathione lyase family enzyme